MLSRCVLFEISNGGKAPSILLASRAGSWAPQCTLNGTKSTHTAKPAPPKTATKVSDSAH
jgi:hypothetical protein